MRDLVMEDVPVGYWVEDPAGGGPVSDSPGSDPGSLGSHQLCPGGERSLMMEDAEEAAELLLMSQACDEARNLLTNAARAMESGLREQALALEGRAIAILRSLM